MNNEPTASGEPVAWMFRGYLYEKDPSDWTVHEHPDLPVIPLYTAEQLHPAKTLTDEEIHKVDREVLNEFNGEDYVLRFARAIMKRCGIINGTDK